MTKTTTLASAVLCALAGSALAGPTYVLDADRDNRLLNRYGASSHHAGYIMSIRTTWDSASERLTFSLTTEKHTGAPTQGFWLVISPGGNPKGHAGELAILYYDRGNGAGGETLSAYAYNGSNGSNSYGYPADFIVSTRDGSGWDAKFSQTDTAEARTMSFDIDASVIQAHKPKHPGSSPWTGVAFGDNVGIWLHTVANPLWTGAHYNSVGRLSWFAYRTEGYYDSVSMPTEVEAVPLPSGGILALAGLTAVAARRRR